MYLNFGIILFVDFEKCVTLTCLKSNQLSNFESLGVKPYVKFHHLKQLEQLKSRAERLFFSAFDTFIL